MSEPLPIKLPPGFFGNGTDYSADGRYSTGNLVRFVNSYPQPVGGWQRRTDSAGAPIAALYADATVEAARSSIEWTDNLGSRHLVIGSNLGLYEVSSAGVTTDITPAGFVGGDKDSSLIVGYGVSLYGRQAYGTPRSGDGFVVQQVGNWSLALFGEVLLAQFRGDGSLYKWAPGDLVATAVAAAPSDTQGVIVTNERIAMTITSYPRLVEWSDVEDYTDWTPTVSNTAGSQVLSGQGDLQAIVQVGREILILSTEDVWTARYVGAPFIYGFEAHGNNCGCLAPNSVAVVAGRAFWFGRGGFWTHDGEVRKLDAEIDGWVRANINMTQITKMWAVEQPAFREVWWFFQSVDGDDCDSYIIYNYAEGHWAYGRLDRSTGIPAGTNQTPVFVSPAGLIYNHDLAGVAPATPNVSFIETGPLELGAGGRQMAVQFFYPDLIPSNGVSVVPLSADTAAQLYILGKDWPSPAEPERSYGPYSLIRPVPTTGARGRQIRLRYEGLTANWMVGRPRIKVVPMGER